MTEPSTLADLLARLERIARARGWSDAEWARRSGVPKETLSRLRSRTNCDLATLASLAAPLDAAITVLESVPATDGGATDDGCWPQVLDRDTEERLLALVASGSMRAADWRACGPPFFVAGLAVMLASVPELSRARFLALAEALYPGMSEPSRFAVWLAKSPLRPSRFLPMVRQRRRHAA